MSFIRRFWNLEQGQDLTEWALLVALVVLGSAALMINTGPGVAKVWTATSATFNLTNSPTSNPSPPADQPTNQDDDHGEGDGH